MKFLLASRFLNILYTHTVYYTVNVKLILLEVGVYKRKGTNVNVTWSLTMRRHSHDCTWLHPSEANSSSVEAKNSQRFAKHRRFFTVFTAAWLFYLIPSHTNPVHIFAFYLFKSISILSSKVGLCLPKGPFSLLFPKSSVCISPLSHAFHMPRPYLPPGFN